eukprot:8942534-Alexandrium_andersonii.AAC.1
MNRTALTWPLDSRAARAVARQLKLRMSPPTPQGASLKKQLRRASGEHTRQHVPRERTFLRDRA